MKSNIIYRKGRNFVSNIWPLTLITVIIPVVKSIWNRKDIDVRFIKDNIVNSYTHIAIDYCKAIQSIITKNKKNKNNIINMMNR